MDTKIPQRLKTYIEAELGDAALYRELSRKANNYGDSQLLLDIAEDEQEHANEFKRIYRRMTGINYNPVIPAPVMGNSYREILQDRVLDESGDFRKYGEQYISGENGEMLKKAYYKARTDENVHALRLLYLLSK